MDTSANTLAETQGPAVTAFDMSGEIGGAFIVLMVVFTAGALVGRMFASHANEEKEKSAFQPLPFEAEPVKRIGTPVHISELTKQAAPPSPTPVSNILPIIEKSVEASRSKPTPTVSPARPAIVLPAAPPRPQFQTKPVAPRPTPIATHPPPGGGEHPKVRFNTSWNSPVRPPTPKPPAAPLQNS